jgi:hypothetical protein
MHTRSNRLTCLRVRMLPGYPRRLDVSDEERTPRSTLQRTMVLTIWYFRLAALAPDCRYVMPQLSARQINDCRRIRMCVVIGKALLAAVCTHTTDQARFSGREGDAHLSRNLGSLRMQIEFVSNVPACVNHQLTSCAVRQSMPHSWNTDSSYGCCPGLWADQAHHEESKKSHYHDNLLICSHAIRG